MDLDILGIDIGKAKFDVALLIDGRVRHATFSNTEAGFQQLLAWLTSGPRSCLGADRPKGENHVSLTRRKQTGPSRQRSPAGTEGKRSVRTLPPG